MEYVKKSMGGGYKPSNAWTHVVLSKAEYEENEDAYQRLERERREAHHCAVELNYQIRQLKRQQADELRKATKSCDQKLSQEMAVVQEECNALLKERDDLLSEVGELRVTNEGFKRLTRERSNAQRDLRPKKQHNGYLVLSHGPHEYIYDEYRTGRLRNENNTYVSAEIRTTCKIPAYRTILQTPYDAALAFHEARVAIDGDLQKGGVLDGLGIAETVSTPLKSDNQVLFAQTYDANCRAGYWEVTLWHTQDIVVPSEYMPRKK